MMDVSWLGENEDYKRIKEHQYDANVMFKDISFMRKPITSFGIYPAIKTQVFHYILSAHLLMKNERVHFKRSLEALYFYCHTIAVFVASTLRTWGHYLLLCHSPFNCILLFVKKLFEVFWKKQPSYCHQQATHFIQPNSKGKWNHIVVDASIYASIC